MKRFPYLASPRRNHLPCRPSRDGVRCHRSVALSTTMQLNRQLQADRPPSGAGKWELWIDRVGGFDVVESRRVTMGGPGGQTPADIAVRCSWRSLVATIMRGTSGDALALESSGDGSQRSTDVAVQLAADQWLPLTAMASSDCVDSAAESAPRLRYRRPSPLSRSAVVTVAAPHRLVRPVDAVVLFDQTILVGPESFNHVSAPSLTSQGWVLFRRADQWWVRGRNLAAQPLPCGHAWRYEDWSLVIRER